MKECDTDGFRWLANCKAINLLELSQNGLSLINVTQKAICLDSIYVLNLLFNQKHNVIMNETNDTKQCSTRL